MACQPLPEDVPSSTPRQQSAPINIEYRNTDQYHYQPRYWQEERYHWQNRQIEHQDDDEDEQNTSDSEWDDVMANGFSSGVIEPPKDEDKSDLPSRECENYINLEQIRPNNNEMRRQKIVEINDDDDLFEKLLAENERKLRQLISYVENVHLVLN